MPLKLNDGSQLKARIIALNTEAGYLPNLYNFGTHFDASGALEWLEQTLRKMEKDGEIAIIAGHVPTRIDTLNDWAMRYQAIIERYQHIVRT